MFYRCVAQQSARAVNSSVLVSRVRRATLNRRPSSVGSAYPVAKAMRSFTASPAIVDKEGALCQFSVRRSGVTLSWALRSFPVASRTKVR